MDKSESLVNFLIKNKDKIEDYVNKFSTPKKNNEEPIRDEKTKDNKNNVTDITSQEKTITPIIPSQSLLKFNKFEDHNHVLLIGPTSTGKTSWVITQIGEKMFNFDFAVYVGTLNQKKMAEKFANMCYSIGIMNNSVSHYYYDKENDMKNFFAKYNNVQTNKTLIFFDDAQVDNYFPNIAKFVNKAKNSNCQCILTVHSLRNNESNISRNLRESCNYYVYFRPNDTDLALITYSSKKNLYENIISALNTKYEEKQRVIIYDKLKQKFYYAFGMKDEIKSKTIEN